MKALLKAAALTSILLTACGINPPRGREAPRDSAPNAASKDAANKRANDEVSTNRSKVPAPYGIDQRPIPTDVWPNYDRLVPVQVGRYKRESLGQGRTQNLKPWRIQGLSGGPILGDYRAGKAAVWVEVGVMPSVKDARDALDVAAREAAEGAVPSFLVSRFLVRLSRAAAGDASGGMFPPDPRFGARGQEPSYLKVINSNGAFFAWTRGSYYFSAHAKSGEAALDAFMRAFPY